MQIRWASLVLVLLSYFSSLQSFAETRPASPAVARTDNRRLVTTTTTRRQIASENGEVISDTTVTNAPLAASKKEEFDPYSLPYSVGIEGPTVPTTSVFQESAVSFGMWVNQDVGFEAFLGYSKAAGNHTTSDTVTTDNVGNTTTETISYSGSDSLRRMLVGGAIKYRMYQSRYFGVSADFLLTLTPGASASYQVGTRTITTPNTANPSNQTVVEAGYGTTNLTSSAFWRTGPRINIEYNLPFLPNVSFGAAFGIYLSFGGSTTSSTTVNNDSYSVVAGVSQTPSPSTTGTTTSSVTPGMTGNTYSIGGTGVNLGGNSLIPVSMNGTFRIRYAF